MILPDFSIHDGKGAFTIVNPIKGFTVVETRNLGTLTYKNERRRKLRYVDGWVRRSKDDTVYGTRTFRQTEEVGPWCRLFFRWKPNSSMEATEATELPEDRFFLWRQVSESKWTEITINPDWVDAEGKWKSSQYEYLAQELTLETS